MEPPRSPHDVNPRAVTTPSPAQLAARIQGLQLSEPHVFLREMDGALTPAHAEALLHSARGLTEWHKRVATLIIGDFCFTNEFGDFAIDMLSFSLPCTDLPAALTRSEDPLAVGLHATNLLATRSTITQAQYDRISRLPDHTSGKQTIIDALRTRIR